MRVVGVDIGSVKSSGRKPSKFAWAAVDSADGPVRDRGADPEGAVQALVSALTEGRKVVLAVEAPMAVPVPEPNADGWRALGEARAGEGNRPWSAGAGAGVLATGLAQTAWMLSRLHTLAPNVTATTHHQGFTGGEARLLLTEAFVSGPGKPLLPAPDQHEADADGAPHRSSANQHEADAEAAARATFEYVAHGPKGFPVVECAPRRPLNLLAVLADWAGIPVPRDELHTDIAVVRTQPRPD